MITLQSRAALRLRAKAGLHEETLGEIHQWAICYMVGGFVDSDGLTWAEIVAPVSTGEWLHGYSAVEYNGDLLLGGFTAPIAPTYPFERPYTLTQLFAENPATYAKVGPGYLGHNGIDFGSPVGTPVLAVGGGHVSHSKYDPTGYGHYIRIDHSWGITLYAHLEQAYVTEGQNVQPGQRIGASGNTGLSSGPHLHFELRAYPIPDGNGYGGRIDPLCILDERMIILKEYVPAQLRKAISND